MAGIPQYIPVVPIHHQYLVTAAVPEVEQLDKEFPVLRDLTGSFYLRQERKGFVLGPYEEQSKMKLEESWVRNDSPGS